MGRIEYVPDRGDIIWMNFSPQSGREQRGRRPALVLSASSYNQRGLVIVCPITSKVKAYPFEVKVQAGKIKGAVLADHVKNHDWRYSKAVFIVKTSEELVKKVKTVIALLLSR